MWKQKIISIIILLFMLMSVSIISYADEIEEDLDEFNWEEIQQEITKETVTAPTKEPIINAKAAVIYDRTSKKMLWGKNESNKKAMASTTKIMTAIVVLENSNLKDVVTVSKKAAGTGGSVLKINTGDKITINDLLYGLMLRSGNDAAVALAEEVGGSIEGFAGLMNEKAKEIGLVETNFVTPHGLDDENHYTTALELAILTDYALQNEKFAQMVATKICTISINGVARTIHNTNELLGNLNGVNGVKTGFTGNAMRCLVTSCTREGNQIITVVLGSDTKKQRTSDSVKLIEYAFASFERINLEEKIEEEFANWKAVNQNRIKIEKAKISKMELVIGEIENKILPIKKGEENEITMQFHCIYEYEAPVEENTKIGNLVIKKGEEIIEIVDIKNKNKVEKKNIKEYLIELLVVWNKISFLKGLT